MHISVLFLFYYLSLAKKLVLKTLSYPCQSLVFGVQYKIHVFYTTFRKPKSTNISPHNFYSILCNKRKPLNCFIQFHPYWSCNITTVPFICCRLQHKVHSIQKPIEELKQSPVCANPKSTTCYPQPNSLNLVSFYVLQGTDYKSTHIESYLKYKRDLYAKTCLLPAIF